MVFHITDAMADGFDRLRERNGLILVAVFAVLAVLNGLLARPPVESMGADGVPATPIVLVSGILSIVLAVATLVAVVVALRTFASEETETVPREFLRRNIGAVTLNVFVGAIVFALVVAVGSAFLLIPGLFALVSLYYWAVYVAVEDQNFVRAFRSSWTLTGGSRLRLFGLGVAVFAVGVGVTVAGAIPAVIVGAILGDAAGFALAQLVGAFVTVYGLATTARAFDQLSRLEPIGETEPRPDLPGTPS
ncbi:hypothetical protein ACFQGT_01690 [Natrialbaceae archaeon GCM10025810]|uniref:hypothetical protein n=1 Tax=Halovalidus salilacus TaxID=3075124 RepID=UPI00362234AE